jgi:hypothetical protein
MATLVLIFRGQVFGGEVPWNRLRANALGNHTVKMYLRSNLDLTECLLRHQVAQGQTADILAILLQDLGRQCQSNVNGRFQISTKGQVFCWGKRLC